MAQVMCLEQRLPFPLSCQEKQVLTRVNQLKDWLRKGM